MKTFKYFLFLLLIISIGFCVYVAVQPNSFQVSRTRSIKAPASVIYNQVIDFKTWETWSFLGNKEDTKAIKTLNATPYSSIEQSMQTANFPPSKNYWTFTPNNDESTTVTYSITASNLSFGFKIKSVFMDDIEKQMGAQFQHSLEKLDSVVVTNMKKYSIEIQGITEHSGGFYIYNTTSCKINDLATTINTLLPKVIKYAKNNNIAISGFPFINYHSYDTINNAVMFSCCIPTTAKVITTQPDILTGQLEPFKTLKTSLKGDYKNLKEAWDMSFKYITNSGNTLADNGPMLEVYITDASLIANPADWKTDIYIALKD
ncbi:MAG: transcription activator effector-binding protein [Flavobacteriaceae bacterium]|nr:transcription activator effector-binding protein [Flavobacteriaceae bacterium]